MHSLFPILPHSTLLQLSQFLVLEDLARFSSTCKLLRPLLYARPRISTERQAALLLRTLRHREELGRSVRSLSFWAIRDVYDDDDEPCAPDKIHNDVDGLDWGQNEGM